MVKGRIIRGYKSKKARCPIGYHKGKTSRTKGKCVRNKK